MPNNPPSFRLPVIFSEDVHPEVVDALRNQDDAITDIQQAIPYLKGSIDSNTTAIANGTGSTSGGGTETVIISQPSPSQNVIGAVNDQTGNTAYTTTPTDYGAFIVLNDASAVAVTLATATTITTPWFSTFVNLGAGTVTITPATGAINGAGSFSLLSGEATSVAYDGANFVAEPFPALNLVLTTTGSTGPATLVGSTLNVPVYVPTGGGVTRGATITNAAGSYWVWGDGVIEAWGSVSVPATTTPMNTCTITFPNAASPFTSAPNVEVTVAGLPSPTSHPGDVASASPASITTSGASVFLQCSVPTGGGGANFDQTVTLNWRAIGS